MNFELIKDNQRHANLLFLRKEINQKWVQRKIQLHLERNKYLNLTIKEVKKLILENDLITSFFIKDPNKQNIIEKRIANIISSFSKVKNFINHSSNVNLFVVEGKITTKRMEGIKSIDFEWVTNGKKVYATQKYTKDRGGAQDNQMNDVLSFL